ncbi:MAG: penicillin-binding transpeptidase domain-containing protein [Chloroflexota bacterium]
MKVQHSLGVLLVVSLLLGACGANGGDGPSLFPTAIPSPGLPTPHLGLTPAPDERAAVNAYFEALKVNDLASMYAMLTRLSQETITQENFAKRYTDALNEMGAGKFDYEILSTLLSPYSAQVSVRLVYHTALVGDIQRDVLMNLAIDNGQWRVQWEDGLILPELAGGNSLKMDYEIPARGDIYDRAGLPVATQAEVFAFGIDTGAINYNTIDTLTGELARLCGLVEKDIQDQIAISGTGWYLPMCEGSREEAARLLALNPGGLSVTSYTSRYYANQGFAAPVTGYLLSISPEQLNDYRRLGYRGDERTGQQGIEKWAENYLSGAHGGSLYVVDVNGQIVTRLGESAPQAANSVYLTIDSDLQYYAEQALKRFRGAVVVLERDSGRVLAMASSPNYDPNLFDPNTPNSDLLNTLLSDQNQPLVNRAAQEQYPLGSVFKIITMAAGLESGLYLPQTTYDCQYEFTELVPLGGPVLHDWTWTHCQEAIAAGETCNGTSELPSGLLTLPEGLMRSCNPYFYHIGLDLFMLNRANDVANMARAFGLGQPTGIEQIPESAGQIPVPANEVDATSLAIGQGNTLVTPLQVATFIAALGNGGTLYRPQLVEKIVDVNGNPVLTFKPEARGALPLRPDNLQLIQDAMISVVENPRGTANFRLRGLNVPVAGKTGTAETGGLRPHAWFAGYTMAEQDTGLPDIAIAVIVENVGEGSDYAAPIFRWMVETYIYGSPQSVPWFGPIGDPYTPTPFGGIPTRTPRP